jgi:hypothetical protein
LWDDPIDGTCPTSPTNCCSHGDCTAQGFDYCNTNNVCFDDCCLWNNPVDGTCPGQPCCSTHADCPPRL